MSELSHFDENGASRMVDVGEKEVTRRTATATGQVEMLAATREKIESGGFRKGDVLEVARLAGIMAAKRTADWIPLCHPLPLEAVAIDFEFPSPAPEDGGATTLTISARVQVEAKTGVEMEALTAVSAAALTVYDMCKAIDRGMTIRDIALLEKTGGRSGRFVRDRSDAP